MSDNTINTNNDQHLTDDGKTVNDVGAAIAAVAAAVVIVPSTAAPVEAAGSSLSETEQQQPPPPPLLLLEYEQDGLAAREIAQYLPYFPFKGIPRFYDIGGFLYEPRIFHKIVTIFTHRYQSLSIDIIAGLDARGFVLGPPIALALQKPFVMMRKAGKMPNTISSGMDYQCEYGNRSGLTVQKDKIHNGQRVLIIDDLVATGGTLGSAISLVKMLGGIVVECACVVELKMFINPPIETNLPSRTKLFEQLGHTDVPIWGLVSEDVLTNEATLPSDYVDDGEEH